MPHERLYSLKALKTPSGGRALARWLVGMGVAFFIVLFLPWQQNIRGRGAVTALNPANRPQTVETAIPGRIQKWHVREGEYVEKGDTILTLAEIKDKFFDPELLLRLKEQVQAKDASQHAKDLKAQALRRQITALRMQLRVKLDQARAKLDAEKVRFEYTENQFQRNTTLYAEGNITLTRFQDIEYKYQNSKAEFINAQIELDRVEAEYQDKISKAESELNNTLAELYDTMADLAKLRNEYANMTIRNEQYQVIAPQSGIVVKALKAGLGETIKENDAVATIMPEAQDLAVAMYVKAMDVPLLTKGRHVRIMFDGWPAIQFSGWPSVSVGTFGGSVEVIDFVNTMPGEFRILVVPDKTDDPWPKQLRMGSGTKGWVMLDDVPVWFEIWRQLNGFPPTIYDVPEDPMVETKKEKEDKNGKKSDDGEDAK